MQSILSFARLFIASLQINFTGLVTDTDADNATNMHSACTTLFIIVEAG